MSTADELADFYAARLDEVEAVAKLAAREGGTWKQDDPERYPGSISSLGGQVVYDEGSPDEYQAAHIALHDPSRVLRDVAAKRRILALHEHVEARTKDRDGPDFGCAICHEDRDYGVIGFGWCDTVRALASEFSAHPDYRQEWALSPAVPR